MIAGHTFVQKLRRAHCDLGVDARPALRVAAAFTNALLAVPRVVLRHRIRHWISHADRPW